MSLYFLGQVAKLTKFGGGEVECGDALQIKRGARDTACGLPVSEC